MHRYIPLFLLSVLACIQRDMPIKNNMKVSIVDEDYESCCGVYPVEYTYDQKQIYVPNVFTPNGDGVNDYFLPYVDDETTIVWSFTILSAKGDSILYLMPYIDYSDEKNLTNYAWNGYRKDGTRYKGLFKYRMRVDDKRANKDVIRGKACAVLCDPEAKAIKLKKGCFYPDQVGKKGKKDPEKKTKEAECYK